MDIHKLLSEFIPYEVEYRNNLTNHLPMAVVALAGMGATEQQIRDFADNYLRSVSISRLSPPEIEINKSNWRKYLGQHKYYSGYIEYFRQLFTEDGRGLVLQNYLDLLLTGLAGGAFHGLIKLAYGLDIDFDEEIIHALAYLCICYLPLNLPRSLPVVSEPMELVNQLSENEYFSGRQYSGSNIIERLEAVSADPNFLLAAGQLVLPPESEQMILSECVLNLFAETNDFTMLHAVTSNHAFRLVLPHVRDKRSARTSYWNALLAAYISIGSPQIERKTFENNDLPPWSVLLPKAISATDVHVIKFVYTCYRESSRYFPQAYKFLASGKLRAEL